MNYPKRESFFAHKFVRLMHKAAVAAEIGRDAFSLLVVVAHTEDAMRYRGPAKFWNSQLIETLGFSKWDQFDKARRKAIEAGWLCYSGDGKRTSGEYFVTIPDGYEQISDTPIEEDCTFVNPENGYKRGYNEGYDDGYKQGMIDGTKRVQCGVQTGDKQGEPSIPDPVPAPNPLPNVFGEMAIPSNLEHKELTEIARWVLAMQFDPTFFPGSESLQEKVRRIGLLKKDGHDILELISSAIAGSYKMLYPNRGQQISAASSDWIRALNITRQYPDDWQRRQKELGDDLFYAMKKTGTARVANAHGAELGTLEKLFNENLKDIRSGIKTSN